MWPDLMITVLEVGIHFRELGPRAGVDGGGGGGCHRKQGKRDC